MPALRPFDPHTATREEWAAYHQVRRVLFIEDSPERVVPPDAVVEKQLREDDPHWSLRLWLAWEGDVPAGRLQIATRGGEDPQRYAGRVFLAGGVVPSRRRQGIGTLFARQVLAVMQAESHRIAAVPLHSLDAGAAFARRLGGQLVYREVDNRLRLSDVPWARLARWVDAVPASLRWELHTERVPPERLRAIAPAMNTLLADVPREDLGFPPPLFEVASHEAMYRRVDERGGAHVMALLLQGDEVIAASDAIIDGTSPEIGNQQFTGVARAWRGRGLAHAVKARVLQLLRARVPPVRSVQTRNAAINAPMLRVNADVGFVAFRESGVYEATREALAAALAGPRR